MRRRRGLFVLAAVLSLAGSCRKETPEGISLAPEGSPIALDRFAASPAVARLEAMDGHPMPDRGEGDNAVEFRFRVTARDEVPRGHDLHTRVVCQHGEHAVASPPRSWEVKRDGKYVPLDRLSRGQSAEAVVLGAGTPLAQPPSACELSLRLQHRAPAPGGPSGFDLGQVCYAGGRLRPGPCPDDAIRRRPDGAGPPVTVGALHAEIRDGAMPFWALVRLEREAEAGAVPWSRSRCGNGGELAPPVESADPQLRLDSVRPGESVVLAGVARAAGLSPERGHCEVEIGVARPSSAGLMVPADAPAAARFCVAGKTVREGACPAPPAAAP